MKEKTGLRLRAARDAKGYSLAALSRAINNDLIPSRISNYEQGTRQMSVAAAISLGKALDVQPAHLLGLDEEINATQNLVGKHQKDLFVLLTQVCGKGDFEVQKVCRLLTAYLADS